MTTAALLLLLLFPSPARRSSSSGVTQLALLLLIPPPATLVGVTGPITIEDGGGVAGVETIDDDCGGVAHRRCEERAANVAATDETTGGWADVACGIGDMIEVCNEENNVASTWVAGFHHHYCLSSKGFSISLNGCDILLVQIPITAVLRKDNEISN